MHTNVFVCSVRILSLSLSNFTSLREMDSFMKRELLLAGLFVPVIAYAGTDTTDEVVVSASRISETKTHILGQVDVITAKEIQERNLKTLTDVLALLPSVQVVSYGGRGQSGSFYVRGGNANQVLVLLDGENLSTSKIGEFNSNHIPTNMIEKVEFIRGHRASVYGANAVLGVINIITKPEYKTKQRAAYTYSSYDTHDFSMQNTFAITDNDALKVTGGVSSSKGFNVHPVSGVNEGAKHGFKNNNVQIGYTHTFDNDLEIRADYKRIKNEGDYDNSWSGTPATSVNYDENQIVSVGADFGNELYAFDFGTMYTHDNDYNHPKDVPVSDMQSSAFKMDTINSHFTNEFYPVTELRLGFGVDYNYSRLNKNSKVEWSGNFADSAKSISNKAGFVFMKYDQNIFSGELSGRLDDNSVYGSEGTFNVGLGVNILEDNQLSARYGTAYRAPNMQELYYPGYGNSRLDPEKSKNVEVTLRNKYFFVTGFYNNIKHQIGSDPLTWQYENINRVNIKGVEMGANMPFNKYQNLDLSASLMNPKNKDTHQTVYGKAKQLYKAKYMFDSEDLFGDFGMDAYADYRYTSKRTFSNGQTLGGFAVVNLGFGLTPAGMNKNIRFGFGIDNLLDKKYEYYAGYPTGGRVYSGTIEIKNLF